MDDDASEPDERVAVARRTYGCTPIDVRHAPNGWRDRANVTGILI
jgi:hypothetical protein